MDESLSSHPSKTGATRAFRLVGVPAGVVLAIAFAGAATLLATSVWAAAPPASWRDTNPKVGQVMALVRSKTRLYAGTFSGRVFRSDNGALTWRSIGPTGNGQGASSLAVDPANPDRLWVGAYTQGVWSTTNGGKTWTRTELCTTLTPGDSDPATWCDPSPDGVMAIAVDPTNPSVLYAGGIANGLYKSTNGGASWAVASLGVPTNTNVYPTAIFVDPKKPSVVLVGIEATGIFRSTNGGQTFAAAMGGVPIAKRGGLATPSQFVYDTSTRSIVVGMPGAVYRSTNSGASWVPSSKGLGANTTGPPTGALAQSPVNPKLFAYFGAAGKNLWGSSDGGHSWKALSTAGFCCSSGGNVGAAPAVVFDAHNATTIYWGSGENGVYKTVNGAGLLGAKR